MAAGDSTPAVRLGDDDVERVMEQRFSYAVCDGGRAVWMCLPIGSRGLPARVSVHRAGETPADGKSWEMTEHADGSISLSPSLLLSMVIEGETIGWHGYLEHGTWREV